MRSYSRELFSLLLAPPLLLPAVRPLKDFIFFHSQPPITRLNWIIYHLSDFPWSISLLFQKFLFSLYVIQPVLLYWDRIVCRKHIKIYCKVYHSSPGVFTLSFPIWGLCSGLFIAWLRSWLRYFSLMWYFNNLLSEFLCISDLSLSSWWLYPSWLGVLSSQMSIGTVHGLLASRVTAEFFVPIWFSFPL